MIETLFPILPEIGLFLLGFVLGLSAEAIRKRAFPSLKMKHLISFVIFALWSVSVGLDIFNASSNTPLILHGFMGAVIGASNKEFGEYLLRFLGKK